MNHSCLLPFLSLIYHSDSEKPGFYHPLVILLIVQFQYTFIAILELLACSPVGYNIINKTTIMQSFFCLQSYRVQSFWKLSQQIWHPVLPIRVSLTCVIWLDCLVAICLLQWNSFDTLNDCFRSACINIHSVHKIFLKPILRYRQDCTLTQQQQQQRPL